MPPITGWLYLLETITTTRMTTATTPKTTLLLLERKRRHVQSKCTFVGKIKKRLYESCSTNAPKADRATQRRYQHKVGRSKYRWRVNRNQFVCFLLRICVRKHWVRQIIWSSDNIFRRCSF